MGITLCLSLTIHQRNVGKNPFVSLSALNFWWVPPPESSYLYFLLWCFSLVCMGLKRNVMWGDKPSLCAGPKGTAFLYPGALQSSSPADQSLHAERPERPHLPSGEYTPLFSCFPPPLANRVWNTEARWRKVMPLKGSLCTSLSVRTQPARWSVTSTAVLPLLDLISECLLGPIF